MRHETINYFDNKQKLVGELIYNEKITTKQPAIIIFHPFEGRGKFTMDYANMLAENGYAVFVADMYGDGRVATTLDDCFALITPMLNNRQIVRTRAVLAYEALLKQPQIDQNKISAIGFCFGGMCVLELARSGAAIKSGITLHGVLEKSNLTTNNIKCNLLILHGYLDPQVPPKFLSEFAEEMERAQVKDWTFTFFGAAKHSFTDPQVGNFDKIKEQEMGREYNKIAAERSKRYVLDFLASSN